MKNLILKALIRFSFLNFNFLINIFGGSLVKIFPTDFKFFVFAPTPDSTKKSRTSKPCSKLLIFSQ